MAILLTLTFLANAPESLKTVSPMVLVIFQTKRAEIKSALRINMLRVAFPAKKCQIVNCKWQNGKYRAVFAHFLAWSFCEHNVVKFQTRRVMFANITCCVFQHSTLCCQFWRVLSPFSTCAKIAKRKPQTDFDYILSISKLKQIS